MIAAVQTLLVTASRSEPIGGVPSIDVLVTPCGCLGPCFDGPNAVVYPDAVWYAHLVVDDAPGLVEHLIHGTVMADKLGDPPGR